MSGLLGTRAVLQTDIDLILQVAIIAIALGSYFLKRTPTKVKMHALLLVVATLLQAVTFFIFMEPVFFIYLGTFLTSVAWWVIMFVVHGVTGAITLVLALALIIPWARQPRNIVPCYKRGQLMVVTLALWAASFAFGAAGYLFAFVLPV